MQAMCALIRRHLVLAPTGRGDAVEITFAILTRQSILERSRLMSSPPELLTQQPTGEHAAGHNNNTTQP